MIPYSYWAIFGAIVVVASALSAAILGLIKTEKGWLKQLISWIVAIGLTFLAWGIKILPALSTPEWVFVLLQGFCVGLVSNGFYDIEWVKKLYELIFGEPIEGSDYEKELRALHEKNAKQIEYISDFENRVVVLEDKAPIGKRPNDAWMMLQNEGSQYIDKSQKGKIKLTVLKPEVEK